ncbi:MAG: hypothetical protein HN352_04645 [Bacteroidetes bacterium]|jgi:hypothetical protein|nr:hypothetical protein [Bacteroidota bacterium]MBT3751257.1 hypothetical protein [Bacteroidota bacterium]MBT4401774.1 hypothetical protein [Bacteroidota bacterium]MBT4410931.1 hypothetical protein [Bacteroidota bacterium]MBT5426478.1 hypothetical protein [Bacteroidota bacterium]
MTNSEQCCPVFDPSPYDDKVVEWKNKLFVKDSMRTFMHMPVFGGFGKTVTRMMKTIDIAEAKIEDKDLIMLSKDPSPWKSELYINVTKEVSGAENLKLSGVFLTKVYDGPYKDMGKWISDLKDHVKSKGKVLKQLYFYYTTCPKCAKEHGHNYVVGFAQIEK